MKTGIFNIFKSVIVLFVLHFHFAYGAPVAPVVPIGSVETTPKPVLLLSSADPLIQATLGEVLIEPFPKEMANSIKFSGKVIDLNHAEKDLIDKLRSFLKSPALFGTSNIDFINVRAKPVSIEIIQPGFFSYRMEITVMYKFTTEKENLIFTEVITSQESGGHFDGPYASQTESISNTISANVDKLSHVIKEKLPDAWQSYVVKRESIRREIENNLKKENRYFRVISANATLRNMPDASAAEIANLPKADIVHISGSLPSGWFQVSKEGSPIGWIHSTLLREDFASLPSYKPEAHSKLSSQPMAIAGVPTGVTAISFDFGSYHALVVGNNNYQHLPKLETAINDAQTVGSLLKNKYGFKVRILTDATRADILMAINSYRRELTSHDNLLIYYAGHGWLDKDADQGYWLPVNATRESQIEWISNNAVTSEIRAIQAKHIIVVADSCYSGKLTRGLHITQRTPDYFVRISQKKARVVLSSGGLEPVMDQGGRENHSVFASAFIGSLDENKGVLDGTSLFTKIREQVGWNADQTPEYSNIHKAGHDGGDFLFVRKK